MSLAGCATGGILSRAETDRSIVTGSISRPAGVSEAESAASDEITLRDTIASADLTDTGKAPISWVNEATGARGAVISITEYNDRAGARCRKFAATIERFDGVSLVTGETCLSADGAWAMRTFKTV